MIETILTGAAIGAFLYAVVAYGVAIIIFW